MKTLRVGIAAMLAFLLCVTSVPILGTTAQADSLKDVTDTVETSSRYFLHENDGWTEHGEQGFLRSIDHNNKQAKIILEWSFVEETPLTTESFFTFTAVPLKEAETFELLDKDGAVIGEVLVEKTGKGKATFNKLDTKKDSEDYTSGTIEVVLPEKEQNEMEEAGEQEAAPSNAQGGISLFGGSTRGPAGFTVDYVVYINSSRTVVNSFTDLASGAIMPECSYELPEMGGQTFVHWYEEGQNPTIPFDMNTRVTRDITLVAYYANAYYVTFDSEGTEVDDQLIGQGERATPPSPQPTRKGYSFVHWSEQENGTTPFNFNTPITKATTLYAVWKPEEVSYRVMYWVEKPDMPFGFDESNHLNYNFVYEDEGPYGSGFKAYTESEVEMLAQDAPQYGTEWDWDTPASSPMYGFVGSEFARSTKETVKGDGSTIVNVYYKRYTFNYTFNFAKYGETGRAGIQFPQDSLIMFNRAPGESYFRSKPYEIKVKWGQHVSNLGQGVLDIWPGANADITRGADPRYYIGWALDSSQIRGINAGWATTYGVGEISTTVLPKSGTNGSRAEIYPVFTNTPMVFENHSYVTLGSWESHNPDQRASLGFDGTTYYRYTDGDYTLPGYEVGPQNGTGRPWTNAPEGFATVPTASGFTNHFGNWFSDYPSHTYDINQHSWYYGSTGKRHVRLVTYGQRLSYDITFSANGGTLAGPQTKTYEYGKALNSEAPANPTRDGYVFGGWYTDDYVEFDWNTTMPANSFVLYAQWIPNELSITYVEKDGTELGVEHYAKGDTILWPSSTTLDTEYYKIGNVVPGKGTFQGWQWRPSASYASFDKFGDEIYRDFVLYANWQSSCSVAYDAAGGVGTVPTDTTQYYSGTQVTVLPGTSLSKDGMPLIGWRLQDGGTEARILAPGSKIIIQKDIVFAAVYEPAPATTDLSVQWKIYKDSNGDADNKIKVDFTIPANVNTGLEPNITAGSELISLLYAFVPYDTNDPDFLIDIDTPSKFFGVYLNASLRGDLLTGPIQSTDSVQNLSYEVSVPDNGRLVVLGMYNSQVTDGSLFNYTNNDNVLGSLVADNVYTPTVLKHKGVGVHDQTADVELYQPTTENVAKTNRDELDTGFLFNPNLYGLPLDAQGAVIGAPRYGYDTVVVKSYEAVNDVGLPSGIKPFWQFKQPQDTSLTATMNDAKYKNDQNFVHSFMYERAPLKPMKFLKVDTSKNPITSDFATFSFRNDAIGGKVLDEQGVEQDSLVFSTSASEPYIVVPMQFPGTYVLTETKAPGTYVLPTQDIIVKVNPDGTVSAKMGLFELEKPTQSSPGDEDYSVIFYIINKKAADLPATGGIGTILFTIISAVLIIMAALLMRRRRRGSHVN